MAERTTLEIGGPAWGLASVDSVENLQIALDKARALNRSVYIVGGGSNLVVADEGYAGLIVQFTRKDIRFIERDGEIEVHVAAGCEWDTIVQTVVARGLTGIECLSGIPGWAGAAPVQNIGAYGQEISDAIGLVDVFDLQDDTHYSLTREECGFGYRTSLFKTTAQGRYLITGFTLRLLREERPHIRYDELTRELNLRAQGKAIEPALVRRTVIDIRRTKSMVIDSDDSNRRSAGSFFVNPIVSEETLAAIDRDDLPRYDAGGGRFKLSAAWLIEHAGFAKGYTRGRAGLSTNHTLAVTNRGGASTREVLSLAAELRSGVAQKFGVSLVPEPVFLGFDRSATEVLDALA